MVLNPWIHPLLRGFFFSLLLSKSSFFSLTVRHSRIRNQPLCALATSDVPGVPLFSTPRTVKYESSCCTWTSSEGFLVGPCYLRAYILKKGIAFTVKVLNGVNEATFFSLKDIICSIGGSVPISSSLHGENRWWWWWTTTTTTPVRERGLL